MITENSFNATPEELVGKSDDTLNATATDCNPTVEEVVDAQVEAADVAAADFAEEDAALDAETIGLTFQIKDDILSAVGDEKILGKPVGNDVKRGKCTYVTKYGLETAQKMLKELTNEAVEIAETYNEKGEFLKNLAIYIETRNK